MIVRLREDLFDSDDVIAGVTFKSLETHLDERGFFREVIRVTDPFFQEGFAQWSHSLMHPGVIKAWHFHPTQTDWWYVPTGVLKVALHDLREGSRSRSKTIEFFLGEHRPPVVLKIPPGVAHGCKCISGPASLFYITSRVYDPREEGRIAHDDPAIGYDWLKRPPIS